MSFSSVINLGTVSPAITKVKLSACTGSTCDNPVVITGMIIMMFGQEQKP